MPARRAAAPPPRESRAAKELATEFLGVGVCAAGAILLARPAAGCTQGPSDLILHLVRQCRHLKYELPYELRDAAPAVDNLCQTLANGQWALFAIVVTNLLCFVPAQGQWATWGVSGQTLSHRRLLSYQFAHANAAHIAGNMLTLLVCCLARSIAPHLHRPAKRRRGTLNINSCALAALAGR